MQLGYPKRHCKACGFSGVLQCRYAELLQCLGGSPGLNVLFGVSSLCLLRRPPNRVATKEGAGVYVFHSAEGVLL